MSASISTKGQLETALRGMDRKALIKFARKFELSINKTGGVNNLRQQIYDAIAHNYPS